MSDEGPTSRRTIERDPTYRFMRLLTMATVQRHRLRRGSAEYRSALAAEERLATGIWRRDGLYDRRST
jgi:hypothetical protein